MASSLTQHQPHLPSTSTTSSRVNTTESGGTPREGTDNPRPTISSLGDSTDDDGIMMASTNSVTKRRGGTPGKRDDEDWAKLSDMAERRRVQNRISQRKYRKKKKLQRKLAGMTTPLPISGQEVPHTPLTQDIEPLFHLPLDNREELHTPYSFTSFYDSAPPSYSIYPSSMSQFGPCQYGDPFWQ